MKHTAYPIEAISGKRYKTGLETYGLLFGHENILPNDKTLYCVELIDTDTSAERMRTACIPNPKSLMLKRDILTSFFPQYDFLGDYHTHPCIESRKEILQNEAYKFSRCDYQHVEEASDYWVQHHYRVGLVLTITLRNKPRNERGALDSNTIESPWEIIISSCVDI